MKRSWPQLIQKGHGYSVTELNGLLITLFERYSDLLRTNFSNDFDHIVQDDDNQPMMANDQDEFEQVCGVCWLATGEAESLAMCVTTSSLDAELMRR